VKFAYYIWLLNYIIKHIKRYLFSNYCFYIPEKNQIFVTKWYQNGLFMLETDDEFIFRSQKQLKNYILLGKL